MVVVAVPSWATTPGVATTERYGQQEGNARKTGIVLPDAILADIPDLHWCLSRRQHSEGVSVTNPNASGGKVLQATTPSTKLATTRLIVILET